MFRRLATQIRKQLPALAEQYDARLSTVPGYANLPQAARRDLEQHVLQLMADCLEKNDDSPLIQYIHERAEQVLTHGFQPEWFQQAVTIPQDIIAPLAETVAESDFVWRSLGHAQTTAWEIVANERRRVEQSLRESEALYQTIFDATPVMFWLKDTQNRTLRINKAAASLEGVKPADVEGKSAYELYPREQAEAFFQDDLEVIRSNQPKLGIVEQHTSVGSGKLMWVETGKTPVHNEQGDAIGVLAFGVDVTVRKQAEEDLRASEEQYRRAITAAGAVPYFIDYATERYRFIGDAIGKLIGYPAEEVTPTLLGQLIQETIMTGQESALSRETAIQRARAGELINWSADYRLHDRFGQTLWLNDSSIQILDETGKSIGAMGILQDITARKLAEESLQSSAAQQQRVARYLLATIEAAKELTQAPDLDTLCRRTVELAREKFDLERCGLYLLDKSLKQMSGTYGTDDHGNTTDEHGAQRGTNDFEDLLIASTNQLWVAREAPHTYFDGEVEHVVGQGWAAGTVMRGAGGPLAILFNDRALSGQPVDTAQQEALAVYCSAVGAIIERKRTEEALHESAMQQERQARYLRATIEAADELTQASDLDTLYRRTVELAREKFDVERCGLFLLDESGQSLHGTYGTDDRHHTTDERDVLRPASEFEDVLTAQQNQYWVVRETAHVYIEDSVHHIVGAGWVANTVLRGAAGPIGILFNDRALSGQPIDTAQQEALAVYCSAVGSLIERKRIEEQIHESLTRRGIQVQTSTEVAQEIAAATQLEEMFKRVVTLIKERFNYYHAQLFRYDPIQDVVVLITGYGETGQKMLATGHKLRMGRGVVGTAAATGQSILATDVRQDADWRPNPYLPDTSGELAVPIKWRGQVLGILDVQSTKANALTEDDRLLLEGLCGQIASAMESTRLLEQLRRDETQLSEALKIAKLAYWEYDVEKDLFLFNDQFYALFHTSVEQQGGYQLSSAQYAQQFVYAEDLPVVGAEIERALNSTDRHYHRNLVHRIQYADGGIGYISVDINIDRDEQGKILRYYGANQDVTERQLAEEAVRRSESQLSEALKIAKLAYWEYDVEKDLFLFNDQFYALFHTTAEQAGGYQISSAQYAGTFVYPDDLPVVGAEIERALNSTD